MRLGSRTRSPSITEAFALVTAFSVCAAILLFSWPDPNDRKRALGPRIAGCCDVRIGSVVLLSRRPKAPEALPGDARLVRASSD